MNMYNRLIKNFLQNTIYSNRSRDITEDGMIDSDSRNKP